MITSRDLDMIGPPPSRDSVRARPPGLDVFGSGAVSVAVVLTLRGPCPRPVLDDLAGRVTALLAAGMGELVIDLSAVTDPDTRLLRAVDRIRRVIEERAGLVSVLGDVRGHREARPAPRHPQQNVHDPLIAAAPTDEAHPAPGIGAGPGPTVTGPGAR